MSMFKLSNGQTATSNGSMDMGGSNEPIPDGTKVVAMITEAKWAEYEGDRYVNIRWDVLEGEYKKRVVFQKVRVLDSNSDKRDKALTMLAAIDTNCGNKLANSGKMSVEELTDHEMSQSLSNTPMEIQVRIWEINDKKGNWISAVSGRNHNAKAASKDTKLPKPAVSEDWDEEIPY